jgi:hypothetical protein
VNIQRQPYCAFHEAESAASAMPCGTRSAISQLAICAPSMPITIANWLRLTSLPRHAAGLISAIYIGETFEASPIATPPVMRQAIKIANE